MHKIEERKEKEREEERERKGEGATPGVVPRGGEGRQAKSARAMITVSRREREKRWT